MAKIVSVEVLQADLKPKARRTDAIQSFECQETPMVRITDADDVQVHRCLAVGESLYSLSQFKDYLQSGACSILQVAVGRIGGITPWLKVAHMAEAFNVPVCPHFLMELPLPLCCAVPNSRWLEFIPQLDLVTCSQIRIERSKAIPSDAPGLGIDWDWAALDRHVVHRHTHTTH